MHVVSMLLIEQRASLLGALKKLCYLVSLVCFLVLAITGFYPLLVQGEHISGYPMMIHATFAPIFAICLAIIGLTWAGQFRFQRGDCPRLQGLLRRVTNLRIPAEAEEGPLQVYRDQPEGYLLGDRCAGPSPDPLDRAEHAATVRDPLAGSGHGGPSVDGGRFHRRGVDSHILVDSRRMAD